MIRIESGLLKGLKIEVSEKIRPTQAKLRQAVGNILQHRLADSSVLDLCAGSGAVGLELLSRGAQSVLGVEKDPDVGKKLKLNYLNAALRLPKENTLEATVSDMSVFLQKNSTQFDVVWFDPPYADFEKYVDQLETIFDKLLKDDGIMLCELSHKTFSLFLQIKVQFKSLSFKDKKFGDSHLIILERKNS